VEFLIEMFLLFIAPGVAAAFAVGSAGKKVVLASVTSYHIRLLFASS
jgi:hypothetical protein